MRGRWCYASLTSLTKKIPQITNMLLPYENSKTDLGEKIERWLETVLIWYSIWYELRRLNCRINEIHSQIEKRSLISLYSLLMPAFGYVTTIYDV